MKRPRPSNRRDDGFSILELLIVAAILVIAGAMAALVVSMASRSAGMQESRAAVAATIRRAASSAAKQGLTQGLDLWSIPVSSGVRMRTDAPAPLPDSAVILGSVDLQGGTGYPHSNGVNRSVAVVLEDANDSQRTYAIVLGQSATVTEYRFVDGSWEALR